MKECCKSFYFGLGLAILLSIALFTLSAEPVSFIWFDGNRQQTIFLNPNYISEIQTSNGLNSEKLNRILPVTDSKLKSSLSKGYLPKNLTNTYSEVFEEGLGGRKMTLPGDIFVEFKEDWDEAKVKDWANTHKLIIIGKLNSQRNIYRIQTSPGIQSLHLANRLLRQTGVISSFPNWWRESVRK